MSICTHCRLALRRSLRQTPTKTQRASYSSKPSSIETILAKPTWSVRCLLSSDKDTTPEPTITETQLNHLLRLSALPPPKSPAHAASMIATLQSQLNFVRAVQKVDTTGVKPLAAVRDETAEGLREMTIGLEDLRGVLEREVEVGYYKRLKRVKGEQIKEEAEEWDVLGTAARTEGRFFVVDAGKKEGQA